MWLIVYRLFGALLSYYLLFGLEVNVIQTKLKHFCVFIRMNDSEHIIEPKQITMANKRKTKNLNSIPITYWIESIDLTGVMVVIKKFCIWPHPIWSSCSVMLDKTQNRIKFRKRIENTYVYWIYEMAIGDMVWLWCTVQSKHEYCTIEFYKYYLNPWPMYSIFHIRYKIKHCTHLNITPE